MSHALDSSAVPDFTFYNKREYFRDLEHRLTGVGPGDRVTLMTMSVAAEESGVDRLLERLNQAARQGARVNLIIDAHDFIVGPGLQPGPLWTRKQLPEQLSRTFQPNLDVLKSLAANGGQYSIINVPARPFLPSFIGRSHIKHAIVNDRIYVGGCNLNTDADADIMIGWDDTRTADWLWDLTKRIMLAGNANVGLHGQDQHRTVGPGAELLIDAGQRGQSVIYHKTLELIDGAEESIYMTCQYFPDNETISRLRAAARRGVTVKLLYNSPAKHRWPRNLLHGAVLTSQQLLGHPRLTEGLLPMNAPFLHAKLLSTEKATLVGSHNYVKAGVDFGTAEIALLNHDPIFAKQAIKTIRDQLV